MPMQIRKDDPPRERMLGQWPVEPAQLGKTIDAMHVHAIL
jgi:hypothetical protein